MLSILIPTYNYDTNTLVEELHKQALSARISFEIIVADDNSPKQIKLGPESDNIKYVRNEQNLGRTATRSKLAEAAKFNNLLFLDADVIPVSTNFISDYVKEIGKDVVFGGYAYQPINVTANHLRYKYGRKREEKTADERNRNPYGAIFSGNILIKKAIFLIHNYPNPDNLYGMDIFFSYQLYVHNIIVWHIDNTVYHLGLEDDKVFFNKCLQSVISRKKLLANADGIENVNGLLRHYKILKKYRLTGITAFMFRISEPFLRMMIMKKDPNLFCLDIYRLGYICAIK